jgi:hypothetical protein
MRSRDLGAGSVLWGGMGHGWYDTTGWQDRSARLFEVAARLQK